MNYLRACVIRVLSILVLASACLAPAVRADAPPPPETRLRPGAGLESTPIRLAAGESIELTAIKSRGDGAAVAEPLYWTQHDRDGGRLEVLDPETRAAGDGIEPGSGRARFTPGRAGRHEVRVRSPQDAACREPACPMAEWRFELDVAGDAGTRETRPSGLAQVAGGALGLVALVVATDSGSSAGPGPRLAILSGDGQYGLAQTALPTPLVVRALDNGKSSAGVTVSWTATGGAVLSASTTTTDASGQTLVSVLSLGPGPGPVTVTATRSDVPGVSASFTLGINIATVAKVSGDNQTTRVDTTTAAPLVVQTLLDGDPQPGVAVQWQVVGGLGVLSGVQAVSDANGLAQAFVDAGSFPGTVQVLVSRVDAPAASQLFTVNAVELRALAITGGDGQSGAQNNALPLPLTVQATDTGVGEAGVTIFWSASGGATLSAASSVTDAGGNASVTVTSLGTGLAPVVVTAYRADQPAISVAFQATIVPATLAVVAGDGQAGLAGGRAAAPVQVQLLDGNGAPMAGETISWTVMSGSALLDAPVSVTDAAGLASIGFSFGSLPGPVTIRASAFLGGVAATASASGLPPGGIAALSGDGQTGNPGDLLPIPLVVRLVDPAPDLSGVPISFVVVSGSATLSASTVLTDVNGDASVQLTLGLTPGPVVVQATAPGGVVTQFNATVTGTLVVTGFNAPTGDGQALVPGVPSAPMTVELLGNGAPIVGQTVTWTTTAGTLASATTVTDATGKSSNTLTMTGAGTAVVTASFPTFNEFVGSSVTFTHTAALAALPSLPVNEASVADALDAACNTFGTTGPTTPAEQDLYTQCQALIAASGTDPVAVGSALTAMLPDVAQTQADAGKAAVGAQFDNLNGRIVALRSGTPMAKLSFAGLTLAMAGGRLPLGQLGAALMAAEGEPPEEDAGFDKWGFFLSGNIGRGESDPTRLTPRYDFDVNGLTAGVDYRWSDATVVGMALGYTRQDTTLSGGQGSVDTQGLSLSAYSTWYHGNSWYLDNVLTLGRNQYDHARRIQYVVPGSSVDQTALASSDGTELSATVTFGRDFQVRGWSLGAYGRASYQRLTFDGFSEEVDPSLAGSGLALRIESRTVTGLSSTFGGKAAYAWSRDWGILMPQVEAQWQHEYQSDTEAFRGYFIDDPNGTPILVLGDDLDNDYFKLSVGLAMTFRQGKSGFFRYERLLARSGITQEMLSLGFRMEF